MDKLLQKLGIEVTEGMTPEEVENLIESKIDEKEQHISELESEKESLSKSNEELTASVEGYKASEEKLNKDLSETKEKLILTQGKLSQITELYKENFIKDPNMQEQPVKEDKDLHNDVLQQLIDTK